MPGGRPEKKPNWKEVEKLCALQCTIEEIAAFVNICEDTLDKHSKIDHGVSFSEFLKEKKQFGKISLRRKQWKLAEKSAAVAIFLGKNMLGQSDKREVEHSTDDKGLKLTYSLGDEK